MATGLVNGARALHWPTRSHRTPRRRSIRQKPRSTTKSREVDPNLRRVGVISPRVVCCEAECARKVLAVRGDNCRLLSISDERNMAVVCKCVAGVNM